MSVVRAVGVGEIQLLTIAVSAFKLAQTGDHIRLDVGWTIARRTDKASSRGADALNRLRAKDVSST